jgi:hypothetical protein
MNNVKKNVVPIEYKRGPDFRLVPATGAYGGLSPNGEIICNFFIEYMSYPQKLSLAIEIGKIPEQIEGEEVNLKSIRELQTAIVMRPDIAKSVGEWLIREADKALGEKPPIITQH